jgi:hypothetical protein
MLPPEPVANADAWPPAVIVEVAKSKLMMSHWYLVLPDPPEALCPVDPLRLARRQRHPVL